METTAVIGGMLRVAALPLKALDKMYRSNLFKLKWIRYSEPVATILASKAVTYPLKAAKIVLYPAGAYLRAMDEAVRVGYQHGNSLFASQKVARGILYTEGAFKGQAVPIEIEAANALAKVTGSVSGPRRRVPGEISSEPGSQERDHRRGQTTLMTPKLVPILLLLALIPGVHHPEKTARLDSAQVTFDLPKDWQFTEGLFGLELTLAGPPVDESRPALSVTALDGKREVSFEDVLKAPKNIRKRRNAGSKKRKGKLLSQVAPAPFTTAHCDAGVSMASEYALNLIPFTEKTYLLRCGGKQFHLKTLVRSEIEKKFGAQLEGIVRSFRIAK